MSRPGLVILLWLLVVVISSATPAGADTIQATFVDFKINDLQYDLAVSGPSFSFNEVLGPTFPSLSVVTGLLTSIGITFQAPFCCSLDGATGIASGTILVGGQAQSATFTGIGGGGGTFIAPPGVPATITVPTKITGSFTASVPNAPDISINVPGSLILSLAPTSTSEDSASIELTGTGIPTTNTPEPPTLSLMMTASIAGALLCLRKIRTHG
jgi:hypothetical protein